MNPLMQFVQALMARQNGATQSGVSPQPGGGSSPFGVMPGITRPEEAPYPGGQGGGMNEAPYPGGRFLGPPMPHGDPLTRPDPFDPNRFNPMQIERRMDRRDARQDARQMMGGVVPPHGDPLNRGVGMAAPPHPDPFAMGGIPATRPGFGFGQRRRGF